MSTGAEEVAGLLATAVRSGDPQAIRAAAGLIGELPAGADGEDEVYFALTGMLLDGARARGNPVRSAAARVKATAAGITSE